MFTRYDVRNLIVNEKHTDYDDVSPDYEDSMETNWSETAKTLLKAELKRRNVGYRELAERLTAMGSPDSERNIANKISRGGFTAAFLLQCLKAIGSTTIRLDD